MLIFTQVRKKTCGIGGPGGGVYAGNGQEVKYKILVSFSPQFDLFSPLFDLFSPLFDLQDFDVAIEKKSERSGGLW